MTEIGKDGKKFYDKVKCGLSNINKELLNTKEEIEVLKKMCKSSSGSLITLTESKLPSLPIKSNDQLIEMEQILVDDVEKSNLLKILQNYGGSNLRSTVNNIMKSLMKSEVSINYSLQGRSGKTAFLPMKTCACVQGNTEFPFL